MNYDLVRTIANRAPGCLSGISVFSQITSETADSVQNFNASLTDWKKRAETLQQSAGYMNDAEWLYEHTAREIADAGFDLRAQQFELVRELIAIHRQRGGLLDAMTADLAAAESDATKKLETATAQAEKQLAKILPNTHPREKVLYEQAIKQAESVTTAAKKLREVRGHLSSLNEIRRPIATVDDSLCAMLREAAQGLAGGILK